MQATTMFINNDDSHNSASSVVTCFMVCINNNITSPLNVVYCSYKYLTSFKLMSLRGLNRIAKIRHYISEPYRAQNEAATGK